MAKCYEGALAWTVIVCWESVQNKPLMYIDMDTWHLARTIITLGLIKQSHFSLLASLLDGLAMYEFSFWLYGEHDINFFLGITLIFSDPSVFQGERQFMLDI